jgi:phosphoglycolate phosphatase-like HAD superfamily hydrolase
MSRPILIFDMDGVLADVTDSYRETIARTAAHFTGVDITPAQIQDYKNRGGFNDDWKLTHYIVAGAGVDVPFDEVVQHFQKLFLGDGYGRADPAGAMGGAARRAGEAQPTVPLRHLHRPSEARRSS